MTAFLRLRVLSKTYQEGGRERPVLRDLSADFMQGEFVSVRGRSGSGKTTLLNLIAGIDVPDAGQIYFNGRELTAMNDRERTYFRRDNIGFVFQFFNLIPTLSVLENVSLPAELSGASERDASARAADLLEEVAMQDRAGAFPDQLSGGEQQRVAIARALMQTPSVVLADEPTGNLDSASAEGVMRLLTAATEDRNLTLVLVTHSRSLAALAHRQLALEEGQLVKDREFLTPTLPSK